MLFFTINPSIFVLIWSISNLIFCSPLCFGYIQGTALMMLARRGATTWTLLAVHDATTWFLLSRGGTRQNPLCQGPSSTVPGRPCSILCILIFVCFWLTFWWKWSVLLKKMLPHGRKGPWIVYSTVSLIVVFFLHSKRVYVSCIGFYILFFAWNLLLFYVDIIDWNWKYTFHFHV